MKKVNIVYVNTKYYFGMCYQDKRRIEISSYLKKYPELHKHILEHELKHIEYWDSFGYLAVFPDILLEFRSEFREVFNEKLRNQRKEFSKGMDVTGFRSLLSQFLYDFSFPIYKIFGGILHIFRLSRRFKK